MLRIGLTGGIGAGKTEAANLFSELGVPVIDADRIARELVEPGTEAYEEVVATFGGDIVSVDGSLDRKRLRDLVFHDAKQRKRLEAILHPRVRAAIVREVQALSSAYCVIVVPLLVESGMQDLVHRVLVVNAPRDTRARRVMSRDAIGADQAQSIMDAQANDALRLGKADDVLDNTGNLAELRQSILDLHRRYEQLAATGDYDRD
ncbi:MAG: dephospho-CoA kinase [Acidiferrobacteraceae bacterium]|jgi:dephospho-CoA kinase